MESKYNPKSLKYRIFDTMIDVRKQSENTLGSYGLEEEIVEALVRMLVTEFNVKENDH